MSIASIIIISFALAAAAPWIWRAAKASTGWCFGLAALVLFFLFARTLGSISEGQPFSVSYPWVPDLGIHVSFYLDGLSLLFALLVTGVGALIMIYTGAYLKDHPHQGRFFSYLWLFLGAMLGVVLAGNLITLFVFWELTSFASYLLIGFNHENWKTRAAALQALLVTSLGGLALLTGFILIGQVSGTFEIASLLSQPDSLRAHPVYPAVLILVLLGAFTKSAQFPFHFWLPNAMEAPTPASAYLHSATMVKAGIYVLARLSPVIGGTFFWKTALVSVGATTLLVGAYLAIVHTDLKRILAYSTIGALGLLTLLLGIGTSSAVAAGVVFLTAHVFYKGALFMVAGVVDHETGERRIDQLSGLARVMPLVAGVAGVSALSLAGAGPFLSFIGKEMILESLLDESAFRVLLVVVVVVASSLFATAALLVGFKSFYGPLNSPRLAHDPPLALWLGPALLGASGLIFGMFPAGLAKHALQPAASAILGRPVELDLALWHGFNVSLLLSVISLAGGWLIYRYRAVARRMAGVAQPFFRWGPENGYERTLDGMKAFAAWQTRLLQNGRLRFYLMVILITTVGLSGYHVFFWKGVLSAGPGPEARFYEMALVLLIALAAGVAVRSSSRLAAVASLGVAGYGVALTYTLFSAPDLAMTQFLVETLTVILLLRVLYRLPRLSDLSTRWEYIRDGIVALGAGALVTTLVLSAANTAFDPATSRYFIENSWEQAHGRNIVNVILVDFRAFDTLGEITVLATAAIGVYGLLSLRSRKRNQR